MKYVSGLLSGLVLGFILASYFPINVKPLENGHRLELTAQTEGVDSFASNEKDNGSVTQQFQHLKKNIDYQQIDKTINGLLFADLSINQRGELNTYLQRHLIQLSQRKAWQPLRLWLESLESAGLADRLFYRLQALLLLNDKQYKKALEFLFLAHSMAQNEVEQERLLEETHDLINSFVKQFSSSSLAVSMDEMEDFLVYAKKMQFEYIPTSLALAELYWQNGEFVLASEALDFLPYDEQYTSKVDELQQKIKDHMAGESNNKKGIKLIRSGSQFLVKVTAGEVDLTLLIDTGASYTALTSSAIEAISNQYNVLSDTQKELKVNTANGTTTARVFKLASLVMGHAQLNDLSILEVNMGEHSRSDGLLGMNFLGQFKFNIDQENALLFLEPR